jgi:hypothetical protein
MWTGSDDDGWELSASLKYVEFQVTSEGEDVIVEN